MSDRHRDDDDADLDLEEEERPRRRGRLLAFMIALFAIGGFGGVLWYAYTQGKRSSEAMAPIVIRADGEPSRVKPDQPGGMVVPHQDKLVMNNMQQANRPQAERLLPPAEAPLPQTTRTAPPPAASVTIPSAPPAAPAPPPPPVPASAMTPTTPSTTPPSTTPAPATPAPQVSAAPQAPPMAPPSSPLPPAPSGLVAPPAPPPVPPQGSSSASAPPPPPAAAPPVPPPAAAATTPPPAQTASRAPAAGTAGRSGEWRVQLGSFPQPDQATAQWNRLRQAHGELQGLELTTVRVDLPEKGVWYRLQAGPLTETTAKQLCEDLKSKKRDCLVVRP